MIEYIQAFWLYYLVNYYLIFIKMKKVVLVGVLALLPVVTFAAPVGDNVTNIVRAIGNIVDLLIPIAFAVGLLGFFWGLAKYIFNAGDEEKKAEGRNIMIWGAVALFVMASIWGIVGFIGQAVGVTTTGGSIGVPTVPRP